MAFSSFDTNIDFANVVLRDLKPSSRIRYYPDILDLFYSIKDLQHYNPQVFEEVVDNIDAFFDMYKAIISGVTFADRYLQIADSKKHNAVNALHSMIFSMPGNKYVVKKLDLAHQRLETLLTRYLNNIHNFVRKQNSIRGINNFTRVLDNGPKEANFYFDRQYTYQFY